MMRTSTLRTLWAWGLVLALMSTMTLWTAYGHGAEHQGHTHDNSLGTPATSAIEEVPKPSLATNGVLKVKVRTYPKGHVFNKSRSFWGPRWGTKSVHGHAKPVTMDTPHDSDQYGQGSYCGLTPHHSWVRKGEAYYLSLLSTPCRFPDCQQACEANNATVVNPESEEDFAILTQLTSVHQERFYLGIHLPVSYTHLTLPTTPYV